MCSVPSVRTLHSCYTRATYHLGLRFRDALRDQLLECVDVSNERMQTQGMPATVTPSSLVRAWIEQRLEEELENLDKKRVRPSRERNPK